MDTQPPTDSQDTLLERQSAQKFIYGRLCAKRVQMGSLDLHDGVFSVGRNAICQLTLNTEHMPQSMLDHVSKVHFTIEKQEEEFNAPVYITDKSRHGTYVNGKLIGANRQRVLKDGDVISICHSELKAFVYQDHRLTGEKQQLARDLPAKYYIGRILRCGAFGMVYLLHHTETCQPYALKVVKEKMSEQLTRQRALNDPAHVMHEVNIMKNLDHPCVIRMHDVIDKPHTLYMVLEYMEGGDLLWRILAKGRQTEKTSKLFFLQMCHAVKYLHSQGITHGDLKPNDILLADEEEYTLLKVSGFGLSRFVGKISMMRTFCGTPMHVAPEVLLTRETGSCTSKVDIWGLGVLLHLMLSGMMPFSDDFGTPAIEQIEHGKFSFRHLVWRNVSSKAKKLIYEMLNINPKERSSIDTVLASSWMRDPAVITEAVRLTGCQLTMQRTPIQPQRLQHTFSVMENNNMAWSTVGQPPIKKQRM